METLTSRLKQCATRTGGIRALSQKTGISESQLSRYIRGLGEPNISKLKAIQQASGADFNWLLTGEDSTQANVNTDQLCRFGKLVRLFEEALLELDQVHFTPHQKSLLLPLLWLNAEQEKNVHLSSSMSSRAQMLASLHYLKTMADSTTLQELYNCLCHLHEKKAITPQQASIFANLLCKANILDYDTPNGRIYFDRTSAPLNKVHKLVLQELIRFSLNHFGTDKKLNLLDLGCGSGRHASYLHNNFDHINVHGIEGSATGTAYCKELERRQKLPENKTLQGDIRSLPYNDETFDILHSHAVFKYIPLFNQNLNAGADQAMQEAYRVLKQNGVFHLVTIYGNSQRYLPFEQYYDEASLKQLCERNGFKVARIKVLDFSEDTENAPDETIPTRYRKNIQAMLIKAA